MAVQVADAQVRFFIGTDGNLYAFENQTAQTFIVGEPESVGPPAGPPGPPGPQGEPGPKGDTGAAGPSPFIFAADQAAVKTTPPQHGTLCQSNADGTIYVTVSDAWVQINTTPIA